MKVRAWIVMIVLLAALGSAGCGGSAKSHEPVALPFDVYSDANAPNNHFAPSAWMGPNKSSVRLDQAASVNPQSGGTCIQVAYSAGLPGWAGIYWQHPANDWRRTTDAYNLSHATRLRFWVRGERGGERITKFMVGGMKGSGSQESADSAAAEIGPVTLTASWQQLVIPLTGKDLSSISGGFGWVTDTKLNPRGLTFYLDEIRYE